MGHRLSKIYTRTGDDGSTGLGDGRRVGKDEVRVHVMGEVDELNALLGILISELKDKPIRLMLTDIQNDLFDFGGEICIPGSTLISSAQVSRLEQQLDLMNAELLPLKEFILPGGSRDAAFCHHARTACRRAERSLVTLNRSEPVNEAAKQYLNRLSDLLFVCARRLNQLAGGSDILWQKQRHSEITK